MIWTIKQMLSDTFLRQGRPTPRRKEPTARRWGADERFHGRGRRLGGWRPRPFAFCQASAEA